jgi:predicted nucleic acid-binding protein
MSSTAYLDSSALVKLVVAEPETAHLERAMERFSATITSTVSEVEVMRAIRRRFPAGELDGRVQRTFRAVDWVEIDDEVRLDAASLTPTALRSLDAIHLASARALLGDLDAFITYDTRLALAAEDAGLPVLTPR